MHTLKSTRARATKGFAFAIDDLKLLHDCLALAGLDMEVRLDYVGFDEEYEEVIMVYPRGRRFCQLIMWQEVTGVFVESSGPIHQYNSVTEAIRDLLGASTRSPLIGAK